MTKLCYLDDVNTLACQATVVGVTKENELYAIELDQTPFYPEGGGQPCDFGTIDAYAITDVQKTDEGIVKHYTLEACNLSIGQLVNCEVDAKRRLDLTQQHSGQHLLSAAAYHLYDAKTVGFHLSDAYTTVDLDQKLSLEAIENLEKVCFEMIAQNMAIKADYPTDEDLSALPLRKQPKVSEGIRVVSIGDYDYSPCGGTHLEQTSQLMGLKVIKSETYKGGTRLTFVVGYRFISAIQKQQRSLDYMAQKLSTPIDSITEAFDKKELQTANMKEALSALQLTLLDLELSSWLETLEDQLSLGEFSPLTIRQFEGRSLDELKHLSQKFVEAQENTAICITNKLETMTQFVFVRPKALTSINCKQILAELAKVFSTKGGGAPQSVQGSLVNPEDTEAFIQMLEQLYNTSLETN